MIRKNLGETSPTRGTAGGGLAALTADHPAQNRAQGPPHGPLRALGDLGDLGDTRPRAARPRDTRAPCPGPHSIGAGNRAQVPPPGALDRGRDPGPMLTRLRRHPSKQARESGQPGRHGTYGYRAPAAGYRPVRRVRKRRQGTNRYKPDIGDMTGKSDIGDITDLSDIPDIGYISDIGYIPDIPDQSDMSDIPDTTDSTLNPQPHPHVSRKNGHKGRQRAKRYISGRDPRTAPG